MTRMMIIHRIKCVNCVTAGVADFLVGSSLCTHSFIFSSASRIWKPENYISQTSLPAWVRFCHGEALTAPWEAGTREKALHPYAN